MVSDEVKTNPVEPNKIVICNSIIEQIEEKETKEPKLVSTASAQRDGFTSLDLTQGMSIKLEGQWKEESKEAKGSEEHEI